MTQARHRQFFFKREQDETLDSSKTQTVSSKRERDENQDSSKTRVFLSRTNGVEFSQGQPQRMTKSTRQKGKRNAKSTHYTTIHVANDTPHSTSHYITGTGTLYLA